MELWIGSFSFNTIEVIILLVCGGIILHYLFKDDKKINSNSDSYKSLFTRNDDIIAINIIGVVLDEIRREKIDIKEDKNLIEAITKLSLDNKYRKNFIERNLEELLEASNNKDVEKIISLLRKEIL